MKVAPEERDPAIMDACNLRSLPHSLAPPSPPGLLIPRVEHSVARRPRARCRPGSLESPDFPAAVTEAAADNQDAHNTMADYFFTDGPAINSIIVALADAFYEAAVDQQVDS